MTRRERRQRDEQRQRRCDTTQIIFAQLILARIFTPHLPRRVVCFFLARGVKRRQNRDRGPPANKFLSVSSFTSFVGRAVSNISLRFAWIALAILS